ncbi:contact-dependent growth inhibition system immunity protein [Paraburkholderia sp. 40]
MYEPFGAYFNQGLRSVGKHHPGKSSRATRGTELIGEIDLFMNAHPMQLDPAFEREYDTGFCPKLWGYTTKSFLDELKCLLRK